ncbi:hypothetical protein HYH02_013598 [Chlamydomonas schloesseri]|uniref:SMP-LTD domain-containing protein n=1 Tax=Chlamydomonas schloesseri TaxID=2026947 RepID=A0A835SYW0_9CHLO|nr:hypothetical protein HYH02_013598 [Chlamydomonas schloesseri]|eukprot:KAG2430759.1 hypothetical protein HYH02_013598 [Chlamydomonas schloesseri]
MGFVVVALLLGFVGAVVACAAAAAAFALATSVATSKYKKQLHGVTARFEAVLRNADAGGLGPGAPTPAPGATGGAAATGATAGGAGTAGAGGGVAAMYESFTLGWLNLLVQHLWVPVLEKFVSTIAAERLQIILNEVLRKFATKAPWKFIESVAVEEVTFGLAPPQFQFCTAKYDPSRSYLLLTMNMHYHSSGFQAVLTPRMRQIGLLQPFSVRLEIMQLRIAGKLHLGLHLTKEPPGVKGIDYSFATPPEFDIQASPVGYLNLHGELPGLVGHLRTHLQRIITRRMVEPHRRYLDLQRIYRNKHLQRVGGPGGCLRVCIIGGRNLMGSRAGPGAAGASNPAASAGAGAASGTGGGATGCGGGLGPVSGAAGSAAAPDCDPYVELRFGREVFRTPIAHHTADPVFNWQFDVRLPADLASAVPPPAAAAAAAGGDATAAAAAAGAAAAAAAVVLHFRVLNARTIGEPEILSTGTLDVGTLALQPNGDARARLLELSAFGPGTGTGAQVQAAGTPRGTLSLQVCWLKAAAKRGSPFPQDAARAAAIAAAATAAAAAAAAGMSGAVPQGTDPAAAASMAAAAAQGYAGSGAHRAGPGGSTASPYSSSAATTPAQITPAQSFRSNTLGTPPGTGRRGAGGAVGGGASGGDLAAMNAAEAVAAHAADVTGSRPMAQPSGADASNGGPSAAADGPAASGTSGATATKSARGLAAAAAAAVGGMFRRSRPHPAVATAGAGGPHHSRQSSSDSSGLPMHTVTAGAQHGRSTPYAHAHAQGHGGGAQHSRGPSRHSLNLASELTLADGTAPHHHSGSGGGGGLNGHAAHGPSAGADHNGYTELCETVPEGACVSASSTSSRIYTAAPGAGLVTPPPKAPGAPGGKGSSTGSGGKKLPAAAVPGRHRRAISHILTLGHWRGIGGGSSVSSLPDNVSGEPGGGIASAGKAASKPGSKQMAVDVAVSATANGGTAARSLLASPDVGAAKAAAPARLGGANGGVSSPFRNATAAASAAAAGGVSATGRKMDTDGAAATAVDPGGRAAAGERLQPAGGSNGAASMPPTPTPGVSGAAGGAATRTATSSQQGVLEPDPLTDASKPGRSTADMPESSAATPPPAAASASQLSFSGTAPYGDASMRESGISTPLRPETSASTAATTVTNTLGAVADAPYGNAGGTPSRSRAAHPQPPLHTRNASGISDVSSATEAGQLATVSGGGLVGAGAQSASSTSLPTVAAAAAPVLAAPARDTTPEGGAGGSSHATNTLAGGGASGAQARAHGTSAAASRSQVSTLFGLFGAAAGSVTAVSQDAAADAAASQAQKPPLHSAGSGRQRSLAANSGGTGAAANGATPLPPGAASQKATAAAHQRTVSGGSPALPTRTQSHLAAQGSPAVGTPLAPAGASGSVVGHGDGPSGVATGSGYASGPPPNADLMSSFNAANISASWQEPPTAVGVGPGGGGGGGGPGSWPASLQSLAQVVKMQRLLQSERAARAEALEMLSEVRRKYDAMVRLRRFENNRALVEGARFLLHLGRDVRRVVVWYNEPRGLVQVDPDTGGVAERAGGAGAGGVGSEPWPRTFQPQELERAERSAGAFPNPSAWAGVLASILGRVRPPAPASLDPLKCFSLYLEGGRALHLQLPPSGNGRSRDEWVDSLLDIAARASRTSAATGGAAGAAASGGMMGGGGGGGREERSSMPALATATGGGTAAKPSRGPSGAGTGAS